MPYPYSSAEIEAIPELALVGLDPRERFVSYGGYAYELPVHPEVDDVLAAVRRQGSQINVGRVLYVTFLSPP